MYLFFLKLVDSINIDLHQKISTDKILIGIMSVASDLKRRTLLRNIYIYHSDQFEIYFVIAKPTSSINEKSIQEEQDINSDLILLDITENMDDGKTYSFFRYAANLPTKYKYYLKADQDSFLHLKNIQKRLQELPSDNIYWGRNFQSNPKIMVGMLYGATNDLVHFISKSWQVYYHQFGPEDRVFGDWIAMANRNVSYVSEMELFYDYKKYAKGWAKDFVVGTLCIHQLKSDEWMTEVAQEMSNDYYSV